MIIVVDSNIVFSAMLNTRGNIGQLIIDGSTYFSFYSVNLMRIELIKHKQKMMKISGFSDNNWTELFEMICGRIKFIDEVLISDDDFDFASKLVKEIDANDAPFVALAKHLSCLLWTGDKRLSEGLKMKGFENFISTEKLYQLYIIKKEVY